MKFTRHESPLAALDAYHRRLTEQQHRPGAAPPSFEGDDEALDASGDNNSANGSEAIGADDDEGPMQCVCGAPLDRDEDGNLAYAGEATGAAMTCPHCGAPVKYHAEGDDGGGGDDDGDNGDEIASDGGDAQHYDGDDAAEFSGVRVLPRHDEEVEGGSAVAKCSACAQHTRLTDLTSLPIQCACGHPFSTRDVRFTAQAKEQFDKLVARATQWRERRF